MEKLEVIRAAHLVGQYLEALSGAVTEEALGRKIDALRTEWHGLAYAITGHVCGVDTKAVLSAAKKKANKKRSDGPPESGNQGAKNETCPQTDTSRSLAHPTTTGQS